MEIRTGINLDIDSEVSRICEASNKSSSSTRNVLYLIVIACLVQLAIFLDTYQYSWSNLKYDKKMQQLETGIASISEKILRSDLNSQYVNFLQNELNFLKREKISNERYMNENVRLFKIPIINLQLHVNDTAIISGFLVITLLIILAYTLDREEINLCIALKSIQNRYSDNSDIARFSELLDEYPHDDTAKGELIREINKTRRRHHYNFLTMNEVFTRPSTSADDQLANEETLLQLEKNLTMWFLRNKFIIVPFFYALTLLNDLHTYWKGYAYSSLKTNVHLIISVLFFMVIFYYSIKAHRKSFKILSRYNMFRFSDYKNPDPPMRK